MTDKTYSTDELITDLRLAYEERICHPELQLQLAPVAEMINKRNAIVSKLKAADALCEALSGVCKALDDGGFIDCDILRKAIKDYEEAK